MWKKGPGNSRVVQELGRFKTLAIIGKEKTRKQIQSFYLERSGPLGNKPLICGAFNLPQAPLNCQQPRGWYFWEKKSCINCITWYFISLFARLLNIPGGFDSRISVPSTACFHLHVFVLNPFLSKTCKDRCHLRGLKRRVPNPSRFQALASMYVYTIYK